MKKYLLLVLLYIPMLTYCQDGELDMNFLPVNYESPFYFGFNKEVWNIEILESGNILCLGNFESYMDEPINGIALLKPNGDLVESFDPGSGIQIDERYWGTNLLIELEDQTIIVAGSIKQYNGKTIAPPFKILPNGKLVTSYRNKTLSNLQSNQIIKTSERYTDGKLFVGGSFNFFDDQPASKLVLLDADGNIDTSFNTGEGFDNVGTSTCEVLDIEILSNNQILVGGNFNRYDDDVVNNIILLNSDGSRDESFQYTGNDRVRVFKHITNLNKVIVGGERLEVIDLNGNVQIDFTTPPEIINIYDIIIDNDNYIISGDFKIGNRENIVILNQNGNLLESFNSKITGGNGFPKVTDIELNNEGGLYISGAFKNCNFSNIVKRNFVKLHKSGLTDRTFNPIWGSPRGPGDFGSSGLNIARIPNSQKLSNGKILLTCNSVYNERKTSFAIFINHDGKINQETYDNTLELPYTNGEHDIYELKDGNIIISYRSNDKITSEGLLDTTFTPSHEILSPLNPFVVTHAEQSDGRIVTGGDFSIGISESRAQRILRVMPNGIIDPEFDMGDGFDPWINSANSDNSVNKIIVVEDDALVIAGLFEEYNSQKFNSLIKLKKDGQVDYDFFVGDGFDDEVNAMIQEPNGKFVLVGNFTNYNGYESPYIIRLMHNGHIDSTFKSPLEIGEINVFMTELLLLEDGRYAIAGIVDDQARFHKLERNGSYTEHFKQDNNFKTDAIFSYSSQLKSLTQLDNGNILVTGTFSAVNDIPRRGIASFTNAIMLNTEEFESTIDNVNYIYPNPVVDIINLSLSDGSKSIKIYNMLGILVKSLSTAERSLNVSNLIPGNYILQVKESNNTHVHRFQKIKL